MSAGTPRGEATVEAMKNLGIAAMLGALVSTAPMIVGIAIAFRPTERFFALMRPLSLAGIFVTVSNTMLGLVNTFQHMAARGPVSTNVLAAQMAETLVLPFLGFACLTAGWLGVAVGTHRQR